MHVLHLVFPFAVYRTVCSYPVPPNPIKSRVELPLLVLLLSFVFLLFVLFFTKWLYIIRRRQARRAGGSRTTLRSGWYDNFSTSSSRFGKLFMGSSDVKSGFLIGLLGSPSWETRYSGVIVDDRSPLRDPRASLSQGSKSCSSNCCGSGRSPVPGEGITLINNTGSLSPPPPAVTLNRSPLLSDIEYMRLLNGRISATFPSDIPLVNSSLTNPCTKDVCRPCVPKAPRSSSSVSTRGTIEAKISHLVGQNEPNIATNNPPSVTPFTTPNQTKDAPSDTSEFLRTQPSSTERETQRPLESFLVALSFPNLVPRFESTNTNKYSSSRAISPTNHSLALTSYRSPKIGPSPLRTMILPPDCYPDSFRTFSNNRHDNRVRPRAHGATDPAVKLVLDHAKHVRLSSTHSPEGTEADSLLDLMSELAQETSVWDPTVFMDENFKKLIARENSEPQAALKEHTVRSRSLSWRSSRHRKFHHAFTTLEDIPEVDGKSI